MWSLYLHLRLHESRPAPVEWAPPRTSTCSLLFLRKPVSSRKPSKLAFPSVELRHGCQTRSLSAVRTAYSQVLRRLLQEARRGLCATPSLGSTLSVHQSRRGTVAFLLLDAASEMTSFSRPLSPLPPHTQHHTTRTPTPTPHPHPQVRLRPASHNSVQLCTPLATQRNLVFGHSDVPLSVSAQPVLMGFFSVSFQHRLSWGTCSYNACFLTYCISSRASKSRRDLTILPSHRPSTLNLGWRSAPARPVHLHSADCACSAVGETRRRGWPVLHSPSASRRLCGPRHFLVGGDPPKILPT